MGTKSKVNPAWNFKGMLMENNSRVITNADATLDQKLYEYGDANPEKSYVDVIKDDDKAHFYFHICSEKGEPAYIKVTRDNYGNIVITGSDHYGETSQTLLATAVKIEENDLGVLITTTVINDETGEAEIQTAQIYNSTITAEETDYGVLITINNNKDTVTETKIYSPKISAERNEDNTGVKISVYYDKEGDIPTVVNLYDPIVTGKRVTGGAEITIQNHIDEEPQIINLYDAGSSSFAPEYDETQEYKKFDYCMYNNTMYVCLGDTTGSFDETKWKETKVSYELDNVSLKIVAEDWDGSKTYSIGDYVMYDKILYKCISNEEGSETAYPDITTSKWETVFIMDEIPNVATTEKAGIVKIGNNLSIEEDGTLSANADLSIIAEEWDKTKTYSIGDYVLYKNILYKCINNEEVSDIIDFSAANPDYTFDTAGELLCTLGGRAYSKQNNGIAYGGWINRNDNWSYPLLLSTTKNYMTTNWDAGADTYEILGVTFYASQGNNAMQATSSSAGRAKKLTTLKDGTWQEQLESVLKESGVIIKANYPDETSVNWEKVLVMDEIKNKQSTVPIASTEIAGIVKVGKNLEITEDGTLNAKAGGGNANEMELTWAEYLALTDEEKNNGTTYYITDKNPTSSEKGFKSTLLATLNDQPQEIDFSNYDLILYQAYNSEVNLYSSAVFMPSFINRAGNIILSIDVTDRIIIDSTNAITLNAFNCAIDVYGMNFIGSGGELPDNIAYITDSSETKESKIRENQHNYSTEEQIIGTWINGKPLYEKVINGTMTGSPSDWTNFYDCSNLNIDNMISIKGFFNYNNERNIYIDSRYTSFSYVYNTKFIQYYNTGLGQYNFETTLIIQYTKTTD